ncbi:MAG TPA: hypothetical protein VFJ30_07630 [Phycisphaerae bacterium]|nr:hypothetical protein [Phycisphaerae bacterium]
MISSYAAVAVVLVAVAAAARPALAAEDCGPVVGNPRVTCNRWPSSYDAQSWARDVWRIEKADTDEAKAIALYKWVRLQLHWGDPVGDGTRGRKPVVECDAIKKININPYGHCSDFGVTAAALGTAGGLKAMEAHVPGHTELEVFYTDADGVERWHRLDPFWGFVVYDRTAAHIATWQEIKADPGLTTKPAKFVAPLGDKASDRVRYAEKGACPPSNRVRPSIYTMDKPLYAGETYTLGWDRDEQVPYYNALPDSKDRQTLWGFIRFTYAGGDPEKLAYGHELLRPYVHKGTFRGENQLMVFPAHGTLEFRPVLDGRFADSLYRPAANVAAGAGAGPKLRPAKAGTPAELVYLVQTPYVIADSGLTGSFRVGRGGTVKVSVAPGDWRWRNWVLDQVVPDKPDWKVVWESQGEGVQRMDLKQAALAVRGEYKFLVKVEMTATDPAATGVDGLGVSCKFQEAPLALPRLMPGENTIQVTAADVRPGYRLRVEYCWDDAKGKGHTAAQLIDTTPARFTIQAAGEKPADVKTNWLRLEAVKK